MKPLGHSPSNVGRSTRYLVLSAFLIGTTWVALGCRSEKSALPTPHDSERGRDSIDEERLAAAMAVRPEVERFCGDCHATPLPDAFPRRHWRAEVEQGYRFYLESGRDDLHPPPKNDVLKYYQTLAPETLKLPVVRGEPTKLSFQPVDLAFPSELEFPGVSQLLWYPGAMNNSNVSSLGDGGEIPGRLLFCDMWEGQVREVLFEGRQPRSRLLANVPHPAHVEVCDLDGDGLEDLLVADLGSFTPGDHDDGRVLWFRGLPAESEHPYEEVVLLQGVGRVADVRAADLTGNGRMDLVVAEFGWRKRGRVSLMIQDESSSEIPSFTMQVLDSRPGAIHVPIVDLNGDGHLDIVALISQEHERIEAYLNQGDGQFQRETIYVGEDPSFGSSGIELVDLSGDGQLDVLMTNGDTMDSFLLKPFHGIRWLENRGTFPFTHHLLTEMPGAYRALAADMTGNGQLDIIASAYLPLRTEASPGSSAHEGETTSGISEHETLIWLEQATPGKFTRRKLDRSPRGHMAMAVGDFDGDGRIDIATGHFGDPLSHNDAWLTIWWGE